MTAQNKRSLRKLIEKLIRLLFVTFSLFAYGFAAWLADQKIFSSLMLFPFIIGLVLLIVAGFAFQASHHSDGRSAIEILLLAAYPFISYYLLFFSVDAGSPEVWTFCGFYYFLTITAGFAIGILTSPLVSENPEFNRVRIRDYVLAGIQYIRDIKLAAFGLVLFGGAAFTFVIFFLELLKIVNRAPLLPQLGFHALFFLLLLVFIRFTQKHTVFGYNTSHAGNVYNQKSQER